MRKGALIYNEESGCMDIRFGLEEHYGGLHCGEGMEVMVDGKWIRTRIEMDINSKCYLVGVDLTEIAKESLFYE